MKLGYKYKTEIFGTSAEWHEASLFQMIRNPRGRRRPDLISPINQYTPRLSLEVKSGKTKGILVRYQLHYGITSPRDYEEFFGETLSSPPDKELLPGISLPEQLPAGAQSTLYYDVVDRIDSLSSDDLDRPFSTIKTQYGDRCLVPSEFALHTFAAAASMRTGESMSSLLESLRDTMRKNILDQHSNYQTEKGPGSWQDIHLRDVLAVFHNDSSLATRDGKERLNRIGTTYDLTNLKPLKLQGPNGSGIYILMEPEHEDLFNNQVRRIVEQRVPVLERIHRARRRALPLLEKIIPAPRYGSLFGKREVALNSKSLREINPREIRRLERLVKWLDEGENPLDAIPF